MLTPPPSFPQTIQASAQDVSAEGPNFHSASHPVNHSSRLPALATISARIMGRDVSRSCRWKWSLLASEWNANGSVCLRSTCIYANVTLGLPCILERTTYSGYNNPNNLNGGVHTRYNVTISRDNCLSSWPKLYCSSKSLLCEKMKEVGEGCESDRVCLSRYCSSSVRVCSEPSGMPAKVKPWQYALTVLSILGAIIAICVFLALGHKRQRLERYYEVLEYYHEQTSLRASIISLHAAATKRLGNEKLHYL
ncbi:hypothetical protein ACEPAI_7289 [Sanghuangporus weigelae]